MMTTSVLGQRWSLGFRPSDDACKYPFLVPSNMFAVVTLGYLAEIAERVYANGALSAEALALRQQIDDGTYAPLRICVSRIFRIHFEALQWNQLALFEFLLGPHQSCSR
jgi:hypothetical protein